MFKTHPVWLNENNSAKKSGQKFLIVSYYKWLIAVFLVKGGTINHLV